MPPPRALKYDLIHSHYWMSGIAARDLKAAWNVPVVHMFHTLGLMKQRVARTAAEAEGDYRLEGEREVLRLADRIVAATPAELAQLQWLYQADTRKVVVIPPGVDISRFYPIHPDEAKEVIGVPPCDKTLLFVGRIEPLKGIDILIQAIGLMQAKQVYVCLVVIGGDADAETESSSDEMERLKAMREQAGLKDLVTFLGKRSQDTLPYYYSAAEVVVVPSHYESFGMVALEAMACGTPVVASQVGGLAFLVQRWGNGLYRAGGRAAGTGRPPDPADGGLGAQAQAGRTSLAGSPPVCLGEHRGPDHRAVRAGAGRNITSVSLPCPQCSLSGWQPKCSLSCKLKALGNRLIMRLPGICAQTGRSQPAQKAPRRGLLGRLFVQPHQYQAGHQQSCADPLGDGETLSQPEIGKSQSYQQLAQTQHGSLHATQVFDSQEKGQAREERHQGQPQHRPTELDQTAEELL